MSRVGIPGDDLLWPVPLSVVEWYGGTAVPVERFIYGAYADYCGAFGRIAAEGGEPGGAGCSCLPGCEVVTGGVGEPGDCSGGSAEGVPGGCSDSSDRAGDQAGGPVSGNEGARPTLGAVPGWRPICRSAEGDSDGGRCVGERRVCTGGASGGNQVRGVGMSSLPRGPNFARNQLNRLRKKAANQVRKVQSLSVEPGPRFFSACGVETQDKLRETRAKLLILENERKTIEEQRKIDKLNSPVTLIEDAMRMVGLAERYAKSAGNSKVAGWAQTLAGTYAESIARSAPSSVRSLDSIASARSLQEKKEKFSLENCPLADVESAAVDCKVLTKRQVVEARVKAGRVLVYSDFFLPGVPFKISVRQRELLRWGAGLSDAPTSGREHFG